MGRFRTAIAATVVGAAIAAQSRGRADHDHRAADRRPPRPPTRRAAGQPLPPAPIAAVPAGVRQAEAPSRSTKPAPAKSRRPNGGTKPPRAGENEKGAAERWAAPCPPPPASTGPDRLRARSASPPSSARSTQAAAQAYDLGPAGPSILAAINEIESGFGQNLGPSSAGAEGWMQFMPSTWATYGVDADHDGDQGPQQPERCDLRRGPLPARRRHAGGPRGRGLRLQPRRLVRRRGHGAGRLLQRDRQRRDRRPLADPEAAGAGLRPGRRTPRSRSPTTT